MGKDKIGSAGTKILVVDDEPANVNVLRQLLEPQGYDVLFATSGHAGLQIARRTRPDLILLDVVMEELDGFETCYRLKANESTQEIPVIFITVKDDVQELVEGFRVGGVDYIAKPFKEE